MKTDDFLSNNVNGFAGDIVVCDSYVVRLYPAAVEQVAAGKEVYEYAPESTHIDQFGFKLSTVLRLRRVTSVTTLTKDGSPHSVQIPLIAQEAAQNVGFPESALDFFVIEGGRVVKISGPTVRAARHLSEVEAYLSSRFATTATARFDEAATPTKASEVAILVGGRCDLETVNRSRLFATLRSMGVAFTVSVISSEQNPEELRTYCRSVLAHRAAVCICIAGLVPGLPAAVKSHLPMLPVISVPVSTRDSDARDIMLGSFCLPSRRPVILAGLNEAGLNKAGHLACELIGVGSPRFQAEYAAFIRESTPAPDYNIQVPGDAVGVCDQPATAEVEDASAACASGTGATELTVTNASVLEYDRSTVHLRGLSDNGRNGHSKGH